jgi:LPS O-antigen subunit length determinant protein (WzzB/FepE family)
MDSYTIFATILVVVIFGLATSLLLTKSSRNAAIVTEPRLTTLKGLYETVNIPVRKSEEEPVKIVDIYVYPIRGIRSPCSLASCWLGERGILFDREIVLIERSTLKHVTSTNWKDMACLR